LQLPALPGKRGVSSHTLRNGFVLQTWSAVSIHAPIQRRSTTMGTRSWIAIAGGALLALGGAAAQAQVMVMPRHAVVVPTAPAVRTWVPGHWEHRGHANVWVDGHWVVSQPGHGGTGWRQSRWEREHDRHGGHGRRADQDRDGVPNRLDRDVDGDGVPNRHDRRPSNPYRY
jgi:hypothetical protein